MLKEETGLKGFDITVSLGNTNFFIDQPLAGRDPMSPDNLIKP